MAEQIPFIRIEKVNPLLDGDYPFDPSGFTNRDLAQINEIAKVLPADFQEQAAKGNVALIVAIAAVALRKAGKQHDTEALDALWDAPIGKITLVAPGDDARPPDESTNSTNGTSGSGSESISASPEDLPSGTGVPSSDTGALSGLETLAT